MKRQDKIAILQRLLDGKISKVELARQLNPDPSSITAVIITSEAKSPDPEMLVLANLNFEGSTKSVIKKMPYRKLEALLQRVGGTVFALPDNNRDRT